MSPSVKAIPTGYASATPYLCCRSAADAIEFYKKAFGAKERSRMTESDGRIGHAEITVGEAVIMLSDEYPEMEVRSPQALGGSGVSVHLYVEDVDKVAAAAAAAGAKLVRPVANQFYGDRSGTLIDPFGHRWLIATHVEDVSPDEMKRRYAEMMRSEG
jgi:PhnB protein